MIWLCCDLGWAAPCVLLPSFHLVDAFEGWIKGCFVHGDCSGVQARGRCYKCVNTEGKISLNCWCAGRACSPFPRGKCVEVGPRQADLLWPASVSFVHGVLPLWPGVCLLSSPWPGESRPRFSGSLCVLEQGLCAFQPDTGLPRGINSPFSERG